MNYGVSPVLLAVWLAASAAAETPPAPAYSLTASDELAEAAWRPRRKPSETWALVPVLKAGALALTESFPYPYPILKRSPYAAAGLTATYSGYFEASVSAVVGGANVRSRRLLDDPGLRLASPGAKYPGRDLSQTMVMASAYADAGKTFDAGGGWKGALYAALSEVGWMTPGAAYGLDGLIEASAGTVWLRRDGPRELSLFAAATAENAPANPFRNDGSQTAAPSGRAGAELAVRSGDKRWLAGVEAATRRADDGLRPYAGVQGEDLSALLAVDLKKSKDPFFPDSAAVAARLEAKARRDLVVGVTARHESKRFALAPSSVGETRVTADLTWTPNDKLVARSAASWAQRRREERDEDARRSLEQAAAAASGRDAVRAAISASPDLPAFLSAYRPKDSVGILAAAAEFTSLFDRYNYNFNEGHPPNLDSLDELYRRARGSYLSSSKDPTLVCLGAAQYTAALAEELGRRAGIPVEASAATVQVSDERGRSTGHAVAQIKTADYGIVFVDWGRVIPTYTYDTARALRLYQALIGTPALMHRISDPSNGGRHVAYLFTEEGRLMIQAMSFHGEAARPPTAEMMGDDPRTEPLATERYKSLLRR